MIENPTNPRAERLTKFIEYTGMTSREFAKQCELKSITAILSVTNKNQQPTDKLLRAIIKRFPQLSYDWIILGSGSMLVTGSDSMQSEHSAKVSINANNQQINSKLEMHDYSLNELNNLIKDTFENFRKNNEVTNQNIAMLNIKVDKIASQVDNIATKSMETISMFEKSSTESLKAGYGLITEIQQMAKNNRKMLEKAVLASKENADLALKGIIDKFNEQQKVGEEGLKRYGKEFKAHILQATKDTITVTAETTLARDEKNLIFEKNIKSLIEENILWQKDEMNKGLYEITKLTNLSNNAISLGQNAVDGLIKFEKAISKNMLKSTNIIENHAKRRDEKAEHDWKRLYEALKNGKNIGNYSLVKKKN